MPASRVLLHHAYIIILHGGILAEDCPLCQEIETLGTSMENLLEAEALHDEEEP